MRPSAYRQPFSKHNSDGLGRPRLGDPFVHLQDNLCHADEIRPEMLAQRAALVTERELRLRLESDSLHFQLQLQAFLISWFCESIPLLVVNLKARSDNPIAALLIDDVGHYGPSPVSYSCYSRDPVLCEG